MWLWNTSVLKRSRIEQLMFLLSILLIPGVSTLVRSLRRERAHSSLPQQRMCTDGIQTADVRNAQGPCSASWRAHPSASVRTFFLGIWSHLGFAFRPFCMPETIRIFLSRMSYVQNQQEHHAVQCSRAHEALSGQLEARNGQRIAAHMLAFGGIVFKAS